MVAKACYHAVCTGWAEGAQMVAEDVERLQGTGHIGLREEVGDVGVRTEHLGSLGHRSSDRP